MDLKTQYLEWSAIRGSKNYIWADLKRSIRNGPPSVFLTYLMKGRTSERNIKNGPPSVFLTYLMKERT